MKRGDVATAILTRELGKPRPVLIVQADLFNDTHASITVVPFTSEILHTPLFRITLDPSPENGLAKVSQLMVDKLTSVPRDRLDKVIGRLGDDTMIRVSRALAVWLGIA